VVEAKENKPLSKLLSWTKEGDYSEDTHSGPGLPNLREEE
jgi:hypothetical protein